MRPSRAGVQVFEGRGTGRSSFRQKGSQQRGAAVYPGWDGIHDTSQVPLFPYQPNCLRAACFRGSQAHKHRCT